VPLNPRRSGQPRSAALIPATDVRSKMRTASSSGEKWQRQVIKYDREGPGILGYYLDTVALLASLCPLIVEVREKDGTWTRSDDPVLAVALAGYKSSLTSQPELVASHVRHREGLGECWVIFSDDLGWVVQTVPNVTVAAGGDVIDFTDLYGMKRRVPKSRVWKSWVPDPYEPWLPTSPVRRALPELRRLLASTRNQTRSAESRLVTNGMVAFRPDASGSRPLRNVGDGGPQRDGAEKIVDDFITLAQEAFHDDDAPSAGVPFPYVGEPAVPIELGRGIDQNAMAVEEKALEAFARAVNFPAQLLTMGPGAANHWNEWLLQESQHKMGLAPKMMPVCNDITEFYLRPMVAKIRNRVGSWDMRPDNVRVGFDMTFLTKKPDLSSSAMEAYRLGLISRDEVADSLGITKPLDIPVGLSEYEHWELATGSKGAPYVEVDADGRLIVPPPPDMGGGVDMTGSDMAGMGEDMGVPGPGAGMGQPEPAAGSGSFSVEDAVISPDSTTATQSPPAPPPQVAAVQDGRLPVDQLAEELATIDQQLESELMGLNVAIQTAIRAEIAKEAMKLLPPRSEERVRLRQLPPEELWRQLPAEVRNQIDVEAIATREAAKYQAQVEAAAAAAQAAADDAWAKIGEAAPALLARIGALVFLQAIVDDVKVDFDAFLKVPLDAAGLARKALRPIRNRVNVARTSMVAMAHARVDVENRVVPTQGGTPATDTGEPWEGGPGAVTGHDPAKKITEIGKRTGEFRMRYRWEHSFFGKPDTPYPPHLALDGKKFDSLADVPGGMFPGDHPWCRCAFLWEPEYLP